MREMPSPAIIPGRVPAFRLTLLMCWVPLALWLGLEFLLFDQVGAKHYTPFFPRWNDQIQYLSQSYTGYEFMRLHGFWAGLWQTLVDPSAQGTLHDFFAVLVFSVAGPSRSAVLSLNLFAFLVWQLALFLAVGRATGSRMLAWAALALPLCLSGPWSDAPGSAIDFRLDHMAMCGFGASLACAWLTDGFRSSRWSAVFGVATAVTSLIRFVTGPYFVLVFAGLLAGTLCSKERGRRTANLALAAGITAVIAMPLFWLNRKYIWSYYWYERYVGPESAIRDPHFSLLQSLEFVWSNTATQHLGAVFGWVAAGGTLILGGGWIFSRRKLPSPGPAHPDWWISSACFLLAPTVVLVLHLQKSPVVLGVLAPGVIGLVLSLWAELHRRLASAWPAAVIAGGAVLAGGVFFAGRQIASPHDAAFVADARKVNSLADYIYAHARIAGLSQPRVAVDYVTECLDGQELRIMCYERHRVWVPFEMMLPISIAESSKTDIMERLSQSDFVFLTEDGPDDVWPFDRQLHALRPETRAWCEAHLRFVERFTIFGRRMAFYQRREIPFAIPP